MKFAVLQAENNNIPYSVKVQSISNRYGMFGSYSAVRSSVPAKEKNLYRVYMLEKDFTQTKKLLAMIHR